MRLAEVARAGGGGSGGSGGSLGLDGSFLVLIGGFSLLEDVDDMLALLNSTRKMDSQRLESMDVGCTVARFPTTWQGSGEDLAVSGGQKVAPRRLTFEMTFPDLLMIVTVSVSCILASNSVRTSRRAMRIVSQRQSR